MWRLLGHFGPENAKGSFTLLTFLSKAGLGPQRKKTKDDLILMAQQLLILKHFLNGQR